MGGCPSKLKISWRGTEDINLFLHVSKQNVTPELRENMSRQFRDMKYVLQKKILTLWFT